MKASLARIIKNPDYYWRIGNDKSCFNEYQYSWDNIHCAGVFTCYRFWYFQVQICRQDKLNVIISPVFYSVFIFDNMVPDISLPVKNLNQMCFWRQKLIGAAPLPLLLILWRIPKLLARPRMKTFIPSKCKQVTTSFLF